MSSNYVTLEEAAGMEGIKYNTMVQRIRRNTASYDVRTEKQETGGRDIVLVSVTSLSKAAQTAYEKRQELLRMAEKTEEAVETQMEITAERPWYVDTDYEWYIQQYGKNYIKAIELGNVIRKFLKAAESHRNDLTIFMEAFAREHLAKSGRTFRRMVDTWQEARAWADKLEKENGCNYDYLPVLALCRKPKEVGMFPSVTPEIKQCIKNIWFNKEFAQNRRTKEDLYEMLGEVAEAKGWKKLPSYQTVVRYISYLMDDEGMRSAHDLQKNGVTAWKNQNMVKRVRNTKDLQVLEMVQGDEHTFDLWVMYKTPNGKEIPIRPKLVCWIDTRSRMIMGDVICRDANSQILKESLIKLIYEDAGGTVPKYLYIDNGKDYTSKELNGVDRKNRHNQEAKDKYFSIEFDSKSRGFYRDMGIEDVHIAMPYEPWTKGQIERTFGTAIKRFEKKFASYTGTLTGSKTDDKVNKDIKAMAERGELLTMEEFYLEWQKWKEKYAGKEHSSLKKAKEEYKTPAALFGNGERYQKAAPARGQAIMYLMKSETALVKNVGICRNGYYYMADELCKLINQKVQIKVDPYDVTGIYVLDKHGKFICRAESQELLKFGTVSDSVLQDHRKRQNRQLREVREAIAEATRPFDGVDHGKGVVGGIDLTIGKNPVKPQKVVQMPQAREYVHNTRKIKEPKKQESDYMKSQAKKALEKLQQIGGA